MRRGAFVLIALTGLLLSAGVAAADRGVALDLGRLDVAQKLTPGGGYRLPPLGVRNPGDEVTSYRIVVSHVEGQDGKPIPADWVHVKPAELTLKPGRTQKVQARLNLPTGADPGDYEGLLAAQIVTKGKGAQVGAAAAAKLTFSVEASTWLGAQWYRIRTFLSGHEPWTWLIPALLATALLGRQLRRRFSFQVARRA
ncbi:MAG: hypothetical protein WAQ33_05060 [Gaiellaceae bacterium]